MKKFKIAVAGTGYVGLSLSVLLAQHNQVMAVDIVQAKVDMINNHKSPIQDDYIEKYLAEKELNLTATLDAKAAYSDADFVVIAAPTNYDSKTQHFDTSAVEAVIKLVMEYNPNAIMVIKSTIPVGYTASVREKFNSKNIIFSPEFLRESKALYDNLYPSRIIVGTDLDDERLVNAAHEFAALLQEGAIKENINKTDNSETDLIYPAELQEEEQYRRYFKEALELEILEQGYPADKAVLYEILELLVETVTSRKKFLRICGEDKPKEVVKSRLMKLDSSHIQYILECLKENSTQIISIGQNPMHSR